MSPVLNIAQTRTAGIRFSRRDWLQVGGLGMLGMSLPSLLRAEEAKSEGETAGRARSCIVVWLAGGPSQPDMWDMKTEAPVEVGGR